MNVHPSRYLPTYRCYWRRSGVFIVNFQHISHLCSSVSIVNFEHVIAGRDCCFNNILKPQKEPFLPRIYMQYPTAFLTVYLTYTIGSR